MMDLTLEQAQQEIIDEFAMLGDWQDRYEQLIELGKELPLIAPESKTEENLVRGCQSRVWLTAEPRGETVHFTADSDAMITKGLVALLVRVLNASERKSERCSIAHRRAMTGTSLCGPCWTYRPLLERNG